MTECPQEQIAYAGRCIDPKEDRNFCGASENCQDYQICEGNNLCEDGQCKGPDADSKCPIGVTYTVVQAVAAGFKWCCDTTNSKRAWIADGTPKLLKLVNCEVTCVGDSSRPGYIICKNPTEITPWECSKPALPTSAKIGGACDDNDGICLDKYTFMYCRAGRYVLIYCDSNCASDRSLQCGYTTCSLTFNISDSAIACAKENYPGRCAADKRSGSCCTNSIVRTVSCKTAYGCKNDDGRITCGPK